MIQANLQRKKLAQQELILEGQNNKVSWALVQEPYVGNIGEVKQYQGTRIVQKIQRGEAPVKAAIIVFDDQIEVREKPTLTTENIAVAVLKTPKWEIGVISFYFEPSEPIEPYIRLLKNIHQSLNMTNILIGGDGNAWSTWWGGITENHRGAELSGAIEEMGLHILNQGTVPTFETTRGDKMISSHVDLTVCTPTMINLVGEWRVDQSLISSDHNAITMDITLQIASNPRPNQSTRRYSTKKAKWIDFGNEMRKNMAEKNLNTDQIRNISSTADLENTVREYTECVTRTCDQLIPKITKKSRKNFPWWTDKLQALKHEMFTKKRRIRCAALRRRPHVVNEYTKAKMAYEEEALLAQTQSWKEFCSTQDRESMWDGIYRVIGCTARKTEDLPLVKEGKTLEPIESAQWLAQTFFPDDTSENDTADHLAVRQRAEQIGDPIPNDKVDPPITITELTQAMSSFNPKKAPGPDGFTADICAAAINADKPFFLALLNKCLELSVFPMPWKEAAVVVLRKPCKQDYTVPKSYRPIGLLSILGKIFEKLMIKRVRWYTLPKLNPRQYGFVPQRSTEDSLYDLMQHVNKNMNNKLLSVIISLDIEGAFDSAWWPAIKCQLVEKRCPQNLRRLVCSYFDKRYVEVRYAGEQHRKSTNKGCVQGSIGGPLFWNLLLDPLLNGLEEMGVYVQAFADDVVMVFSGHTALEIENKANPALRHVHEWGTRNKLKFAAHKTHAMVITKKLKFDSPRLSMGGSDIVLVDKIKILGLIVDKKLTYNQHTAHITRKALNIYKQLSRAAKISWGLNTSIIRTIYTAVIEPIVLYAASVWVKAADKITTQKLLHAMQRGFAQKMCKSYRTVSLHAALLLARILPLELRINEAAHLYEARRGKPQRELIGDREVEERICFMHAPHPAAEMSLDFLCLEDLSENTKKEHNILGQTMYTDGSKIDGGVGAAVTIWEGDRELIGKKYKLEGYCTVFQAELFALLKATELALETGAETTNVMSDSRSSLELLRNSQSFHPLSFQIRKNIKDLQTRNQTIRLFWIRAHVGVEGNERADQLAKQAAKMKVKPIYDCCPVSYIKRELRSRSVSVWNDMYVSGETAAGTKLFWPCVVTAYRILPKITLDPVLVQVMTGHGGFAAYLHKYKCKDNPSCICDPEEEETVVHLLTDCPQHLRQRNELEIKIKKNINKTTIPEILSSKKHRSHFLSYCKTVANIAIKRNKTKQ
ncbi:hypothetical protein O0L34_g16912 [Tuta absoluta]|nr:hypothetical protein O0L34_g16912 [Tuta absoluta]